MSSGYARGLGLPDPQLATIIACAVGHLPVRQDTELVVGFTVEQLQEKGVLSYQDHAYCEGYQSIRVTFVMLKRWVHSLAERIWYATEVCLWRKHPVPAEVSHARTTLSNLLRPLQQWFEMEGTTAVCAASRSGLREEVAATLASIRANAVLVAANNGSLVRQALREAGVEVAAKPLRHCGQPLGLSDGALTGVDRDGGVCERQRACSQADDVLVTQLRHRGVDQHWMTGKADNSPTAPRTRHRHGTCGTASPTVAGKRTAEAKESCARHREPTKPRCASVATCSDVVTWCGPMFNARPLVRLARNSKAPMGDVACAKTAGARALL